MKTKSLIKTYSMAFIQIRFHFLHQFIYLENLWGGLGCRRIFFTLLITLLLGLITTKIKNIMRNYSSNYYFLTHQTVNVVLEVFRVTVEA